MNHIYLGKYSVQSICLLFQSKAFMKSNQYFSTASSCGQPHKPIKSLVVCNLEHGQKLLQFSWRGELSCCCYAVIRQSTSRQQAVNKQSKGNQYNDYLRKYSRVLLDFPGLTKAVTYDERPKMKRVAQLKAVFFQGTGFTGTASLEIYQVSRI